MGALISYIQPFDINCNIGYEYNLRVNDCQTEWVCITDQDVCFLLNNTKKQIHDIALKGEFDLYGCLTNRVSWKHQLYQGKISDDPDIRNHIAIAQKLHDEQYGIVEPTIHLLAGFFMLFRKSAWEQVGGFAEKEKSQVFDKLFSNAIPKRGIMQGVYVWHSYRLLSKSPVSDWGHLRMK